jgi:carbamoyl-phosphate synthase large subunit
METLTVMTTGAGSPGAYSLFKSLRAGAAQDGRKLRIVTADMNPDSYGFHLAEKAYKIPAGSSSDFIPRIADICRKEKPAVLFSWVDPELLPLAKAREEIESIGVKVTISDAQAIESSQNKRKCYEAFSKDGIAPEFRFANSASEFEKAARELGFPKNPICFKPAFGHGMRGFRVLKPSASRGELLFKEKPDSAFADFKDMVAVLQDYEKGGVLPELVVMEYLEGKEYTVDVLLEKKKPVVTIPRVRAVTKGGISTTAIVEKNQEIIEKTEQVCRKLGLDFNINVQFKYGKNGPRLIEVQPRLAGTTVACVGAGANLPYLGLKIALGEKIQAPKVKWGTVMKRFWEEVYTDGKSTWFLKPGL